MSNPIRVCADFTRFKTCILRNAQSRFLYLVQRLCTRNALTLIRLRGCYINLIIIIFIIRRFFHLEHGVFQIFNSEKNATL